MLITIGPLIWCYVHDILLNHKVLDRPLYESRTVSFEYIGVKNDTDMESEGMSSGNGQFLKLFPCPFNRHCKLLL